MGLSSNREKGLQGTLFFEKVVDDFRQFSFSSNTQGPAIELDGLVGVDEEENILFVKQRTEITGAAINFFIDVYTLDRNGKKLSVFSKPGSYTLERNPRVSPDGSVIALYYEIEGGNAALALLKRDGTLLRSYDSSDGPIRSFDLTSDGKLIIGQGDSIYQVDFKVGITKQLLRRFPGSDIWDTLSVSPDGSQIVFSMSQKGLTRGRGDFDLYSMNIDGTGLRTLVDNESDDIHGAAWSPDGKYLAITRGIDVHDAIQPCRGALYIINATASNLTLEESSTDVTSLVDEYGKLFCSNPAETPIWTNW
ncbi:TolB family protein [Hahella ganghwensis]|uniref:TolB family protein n=1 Tax=Hahella ganghwensis TaxID=286420 RepID=UPI0003784B90|nr:PD40 domain-containing protein [Hahella ganghwensis]